MLVNEEHENRIDQSATAQYVRIGGASVLALDPIYLKMQHTKYAVCRQNSETSKFFVRDKGDLYGTEI